jgi:hypothetical protein
MTGTELTRSTAEDVLAVGPTAWFPERLLRAPRAKRFLFVRYAWIRDSVRELGLIEGSAAEVRQGMQEEPPRTARARFHNRAEDLVPKFEWSAIERDAHRGAESQGEPVEAELFVLASGQGVFIEKRDGARANVAEVDEELLVRQQLVSQLVPGDFLVVRNEGDADYVRVYADQLLGTRAVELRDLQRRMKRRLNEEIDLHGVTATAEKLRGFGSSIASENNLRRWADPANITTKEKSDFSAICRLIGTVHVDRLWGAMQEIRGAHSRAGNEVRRLLLAELKRAELGTLLRRGWDDYDVEEIEGEGSLRVARLTGRAPSAQSVPRSRLRKAFNIGEELWLG